MLRRTLLTAAATTLAGCGLAPSDPSTEGYPQSPPNALFSFEWRPDESGYEVRFDRGNAMTAANTAALYVTSDDDTETLWAASEGSGHDEIGPPAGSFPVEPGASLLHPCKRATRLRVVWESADGDNSVAFDSYEYSAPTTTEGTE
ncbi:hypothetical protein [Haloarcula pelagica]|uniref:hypothetical protein n=1 Tax=Haloarcula pelagica TaxID=3033389 RepID=UPI0024C2CF40|nr:hypothetical protein [Halomicroarcula sp. YJ-61-S]